MFTASLFNYRVHLYWSLFRRKNSITELKIEKLYCVPVDPNWVSFPELFKCSSKYFFGIWSGLSFKIYSWTLSFWVSRICIILLISSIEPYLPGSIFSKIWGILLSYAMPLNSSAKFLILTKIVGSMSKFACIMDVIWIIGLLNSVTLFYIGFPYSFLPMNFAYVGDDARSWL